MHINLVNYTTTFIDYPSPDEWAVIFYFSGCSHNCYDCHNKQLQTYNIGESYNEENFYK